jgi:hypothetical protein
MRTGRTRRTRTACYVDAAATRSRLSAATGPTTEQYAQVVVGLWAVDGNAAVSTPAL